MYVYVFVHTHVYVHMYVHVDAHMHSVVHIWGLLLSSWPNRYLSLRIGHEHTESILCLFTKYMSVHKV